MTLGTSQEKFEIFSEESKKKYQGGQEKQSMNGNTTKKNPDGTWERHRDYL